MIRVLLIEDNPADARLEQRLAELEDQLLDAQKIAAIGRLAGVIAHDFNNLLTVIHGSVAVGKQSLPADHPGRRSFDLIEEAGRHTGQLTRQLLALGRRHGIEPRIVDLNQVIADLEVCSSD